MGRPAPQACMRQLLTAMCLCMHHTQAHPELLHLPVEAPVQLEGIAAGAREVCFPCCAGSRHREQHAVSETASRASCRHNAVLFQAQPGQVMSEHNVQQHMQQQQSPEQHQQLLQHQGQHGLALPVSDAAAAVAEAPLPPISLPQPDALSPQGVQRAPQKSVTPLHSDTAETLASDSAAVVAGAPPPSACRSRMRVPRKLLQHCSRDLKHKGQCPRAETVVA